MGVEVAYGNIWLIEGWRVEGNGLRSIGHTRFGTTGFCCLPAYCCLHAYWRNQLYSWLIQLGMIHKYFLR